ncbi:MAG: vitamin K epoxide reductase family protein [Bifidobacteriaceae bacterium]|nr:vitamin K epoxide reductase family protein [Bifidobacteriaceae bacterium]
MDETYDDTEAAPSPLPTGWRHGFTWLYIVDLVVSFAAIVASFILSADTLYSARHPDELLNCDVNAKVSCSTVAQSWQAEIIKFGNLSFPNAFFGIAAESVFITIAVLGISKVVFPRWFSFCAWLGNLAALAYAYWLLSQSLFVINALCPWCILLMFSTTIQFMAFSHAMVTVQGLPSKPRKLATYYRLNIDILVDTFWIVAIIVVILAKDGTYILG